MNNRVLDPRDCMPLRVLDEPSEWAITEYSIGNTTFRIREWIVLKRAADGFRVWPAALALARNLEISPAASAVVEIGCGCGLPGLVALAAGCRVTFADRDAEVLANAAQNASANGFENFEILQCDWRSLPPRQWDLACGSELLDVAEEARLLGDWLQAAAPHAILAFQWLEAASDFESAMAGRVASSREMTFNEPADIARTVTILEVAR